MSKRKLETVDEESTTPEQRRKSKKRKTNIPKHTNIEGPVQVSNDRRNEKLARKFAKREIQALEKQQRDEPGSQGGIKTGEGEDDTRSIKTQEKLLEKGRTGAFSNRHGSSKREKEIGQKSTGEQKLKKEKLKDRTVRRNGKKSKEKGVKTVTWKVSDAFGGQMLDVDPVFSPDEK